MIYRKYIKRFIDIILSSIILLLSSPLILGVTLILVFINNGNPFFFQDRPGFLEKKIRIIKFKTMNEAKDSSGNFLPDVERLTLFGNILRKTSIDEIPQFISVLKGDMSLIGPRPLLLKYLQFYSVEQKRRHNVKPGITGWAQVNGRNRISWKEKFDYDIYYVDNLSFDFDLKILWLTALNVIKMKDVNQSINRPMVPFDGTN
jgi:lipopolysaccharide/colanic/teichoic acid biosynthesis glycosyltransferase